MPTTTCITMSWPKLLPKITTPLFSRCKFDNRCKILFSKRYFTQENNIIRSPLPEVQIPNITLYEYLTENISKWHDKIAFECYHTGKKFTYEEIRKYSFNLASFLHKDGVRKGDTAAIILPNVPEYFITLIGSMQAGLIVSTINPAYTSGEIKYQIQNCSPKVLFTLNSMCPTVKKAIKGTPYENIRIISINENREESTYPNTIKFSESCAQKFDFKEYDYSPNDVTLLPFSSGTTGRPKGVQLTHRNLVANALQCAVKEYKTFRDTHGSTQDVVPILLPMFHLYGLGVIGFNLFAKGVKLLTVQHFNTKAFLDILINRNSNILYLVPPLVLMILNNPELPTKELSSTVRSVISAAAPLGAADIQRFHEKTENKIEFLQLYGMTECAPVVLHQSKQLKGGHTIGGSGLLVPNTSCKIVGTSDDTSVQALGPNESGELLVKGPQVMKGYFNNQKATLDTFTKDGWLKTGDVGHYNKHGHFFITDRMKELIKVKGYQVAPAELEEVLRDHPGIEDAAVIGVYDEDSGEVPKAFVVPREGYKPDADEIHKYMAHHLTKYKQLRGGIVFVKKIPKTASGKILRRKLKEM